MKKAAILQVLILVTLTGCDLFKSSVNQTEQLPPATQEGKNTFCCLVNGKAWLPKGFNGTSNLSLSYDPGYDSGTFDLRSYRYINQTESEDIVLYLNKLRMPETFDLRDKAHSEVVFYTVDNLCSYRSRDLGVLVGGNVAIGKLDIVSGIVAGTFEFTLIKANCDTLRITQGRFDMKI